VLFTFEQLVLEARFVNRAANRTKTIDFPGFFSVQRFRRRVETASKLLST
jgi:hypothetical protein